jgi:tetratricopeptide (TPR) repeat protein
MPNPRDSKPVADAKQPTPARPATDESLSILVALWNFFEKKPRTCTVLLFVPLILLAFIWEQWSDRGKQHVKPEQPSAENRATLERAKAASASGRYEEAITHLTRVIDETHGSYEALQLRAQCYIGTERFAEAVSDLSAVIDSRPGRSTADPARLDRAAANYRLGRYAETEADYIAVIGDFDYMDGEDPPGLHVAHAIVGLAAAKIRLGKAAEASRILDAFIGTQVTVREVTASKRMVRQKSRWTGTGPAKRLVSTPEPYSVPTSWSNKLYSLDLPALKVRGDAKADLGDWDGAVADYQRAEQLASDDPEVISRLAMAYFQLGRHQDAADVRSRIPGLAMTTHEVLPTIAPTLIRSESGGQPSLMDELRRKKLQETLRGKSKERTNRERTDELLAPLNDHRFTEEEMRSVFPLPRHENSRSE